MRVLPEPPSPTQIDTTATGIRLYSGPRRYRPPRSRPREAASGAPHPHPQLPIREPGPLALTAQPRDQPPQLATIRLNRSLQSCHIPSMTTRSGQGHDDRMAAPRSRPVVGQIIDAVSATQSFPPRIPSSKHPHSINVTCVMVDRSRVASADCAACLAHLSFCDHHVGLMPACGQGRSADAPRLVLGACSLGGEPDSGLPVVLPSKTEQGKRHTPEALSSCAGSAAGEPSVKARFSDELGRTHYSVPPARARSYQPDPASSQHGGKAGRGLRSTWATFLSGVETAGQDLRASDARRMGRRGRRPGLGLGDGAGGCHRSSSWLWWGRLRSRPGGRGLGWWRGVLRQPDR